MAHHPPFPKQPPKGQYIRHIWVYRLLKADAAMTRMVQLCNATMKRTSKAAHDTEDALWAAMGALQEQISADTIEAKDRGELLFCWHGTNATAIGQGGAA